MKVNNNKPVKDSARIVVMLAPSEKKRVKEQAKQHHVSISQFVRMCIS